MSEPETIKDFAQSIKDFFVIFDFTFLIDEKSEELLKEVKSSLKQKVSYNESCLPVIMAIGGNYDSTIDRIKITETEALLALIGARKNLLKAKEKERSQTANNAELLASMFGI